MNKLNKIKKNVDDFFKKRYIQKELKSKFSNMGKQQNNEEINLLTDSLFRASKIIDVEVQVAEKKRSENKNKLLFDDIKKIIDKHYKNREESLKKENEKLSRQLKFKDKKINEIREKILTVLTVGNIK